MSKIISLVLAAVMGLQPTPIPLEQTNTMPVSTPMLAEKIDDSTYDRPVQEVRRVWITAYSSTPDQTDDTPFITASNTRVREGIVAANFLPFGTEIQIPDLFGDRIFIVEDRMHSRKKEWVDIWMPTRNDARKFGIIKGTDIIVLEN